MAEVASLNFFSPHTTEEPEDDLRLGIFSLFGDTTDQHSSSTPVPTRSSNMLETLSSVKPSMQRFMGADTFLEHTTISNFSEAGEDDWLGDDAALTTPPHTSYLIRVDSVIDDTDPLSFQPDSPPRATSPFDENNGEARGRSPHLLRGTNKNVPTTYLDKDQSGNYDPAEERQKKRKRLPNPCERRRVERGPDVIPDKRYRRFKSSYTARLNGGQLPFTISLTTAELITAAQSIPDNWPDYLNIYDDNSNDEAGPSSQNSRRRPRDEDDYVPLSDPLGEEEEGLLHHPAARGCRHCRGVDTRCPLLDDGNAWPCAFCIKDNQDCELITPPIIKASCETCKSLKLRCSFRDDKEGKQHAKCEHCGFLGLRCIAGTAEGYERQRIYLGRDYDDDPYIPPSRKFASCSNCREKDWKCSLGKTDPPPCENCKDQDLVCDFEEFLRKTKSKGNGKAKATEIIRSDDSSADEDFGEELWEVDVPPIHPGIAPRKAPKAPKARPTIQEVDAKKPYQRKWINTSLCHPITFNEDTTKNQFSDPFRKCNWCFAPDFGVFGYGEHRMVWAQEPASKLCYHELRGGHEELGRFPSRMCTQCTMTRLQLINCLHFEIQGIPSQDMDAILNLINNEEPEQYRYLCSICPCLPAYQCCTSQDIDGGGQESTSGKEGGCGLLLCFNCRDMLIEFGGDLQRMLKEINVSTERARYPAGLRADAELLHDDGLLMRNVFADIE